MLGFGVELWGVGLNCGVFGVELWGFGVELWGVGAVMG